MNSEATTMELATLGAGCFWCLEAVYQRVKGVESVVSGYAGGYLADPTYDDICRKNDAGGHAEVVQVKYDPRIVSYEDILNIFFRVHDPTTLNQQGNDIGPQYRSIVLYENDKQKEIANKVRDEVDATKIYADKIVTEIAELKKLYPAEGFHQNFYNENPNQGYCVFVVKPKLDKFYKLFKPKGLAVKA